MLNLDIITNTEPTMQHRPRQWEYKIQFHKKPISTFPNIENDLQESIQNDKKHIYTTYQK